MPKEANAKPSEETQQQLDAAVFRRLLKHLDDNKVFRTST